MNYRQIPPGKMDEAIHMYRDVVGPDRKAQKGFKGAWILTDRGAGKLMAIALWETEAGMIAAVPPGGVDAITGESPVREHYEVSIDDSPVSEEGKTTYARVNARQVPPDKMDEAIRMYLETTLPERKTHKGFVGAYVMTERSIGKILTVSLWETEADARASGTPGYVDAVTGEPPVRESYEVSVQV